MNERSIHVYRHQNFSSSAELCRVTMGKILCFVKYPRITLSSQDEIHSLKSTEIDAVPSIMLE